MVHTLFSFWRFYETLLSLTSVTIKLEWTTNANSAQPVPPLLGKTGVAGWRTVLIQSSELSGQLGDLTSCGSFLLHCLDDYPQCCLSHITNTETTQRRHRPTRSKINTTASVCHKNFEGFSFLPDAGQSENRERVMNLCTILAQGPCWSSAMCVSYTQGVQVKHSDSTAWSRSLSLSLSKSITSVHCNITLGLGWPACWHLLNYSIFLGSFLRTLPAWL
jgi:hypothetical protein